MKITKIEPILSGNRHLFVKVYTDEGIVGLGESGLWAMREGVVGTLKCLEPVLVGEDVNKINFITGNDLLIHSGVKASNNKLYIKTPF